MAFTKQKRKITGIILITVGVTALLCIGCFMAFGGDLLVNQPSVLEELEPEQVPLAGPAKAGESISIPGFERMTIPAGEKTVPATLYNPEGNECYFKISIILSASSEEIYASKLISPGQRLYQIELSRALEAGTYSAVLHYNAYTLTDQKDLNGANVPFELVVN